MDWVQIPDEDPLLLGRDLSVHTMLSTHCLYSGKSPWDWSFSRWCSSSSDASKLIIRVPGHTHFRGIQKQRTCSIVSLCVFLAFCFTTKTASAAPNFAEIFITARWKKLQRRPTSEVILFRFRHFFMKLYLNGLLTSFAFFLESSSSLFSVRLSTPVFKINYIIWFISHTTLLCYKWINTTCQSIIVHLVSLLMAYLFRHTDFCWCSDNEFLWWFHLRPSPAWDNAVALSRTIVFGMGTTVWCWMSQEWAIPSHILPNSTHNGTKTDRSVSDPIKKGNSATDGLYLCRYVHDEKCRTRLHGY